MSVQDAEPTPRAVNGTIPDPDLDVTKLHALPSEQQELYLLTFVSELWRHVEALSNDALGAHTLPIKKEIVKIIGLGSPSPSRIIRHTLGQILASLFARGSKSLLFETINELVGLANAGKGERDVGTKHAAVVAIGHVYLVNGESAISLSGLVSSSLLKLLKSAQSNAGFRASIYRALGFIAKGMGNTIDDHVAREIWKQARSAASTDKAAIVQRHALLCLASLLGGSEIFNNSNDFDALKTTIFKSIDSGFPSVRHAAAAAFAQALLVAHSEVEHPEAVPIVRKPKKSKKQAGADEDVEEDRSSSPVPPKPTVRLVLSLREILRLLSSFYTKTSTNNRGRAGIAICYKLLLQQLPEKVVEDHYSSIAGHCFSELLNSPTINFNRYRILLTRRYVQAILDDLVGAKILSESGQTNAAKWIINDILKNYPQVIRERREPPKRVLTGALRTLSNLITDLGAASAVFQDQCRETILQVLQHPNYTVQIHAASCLQALVQACPTQIIKTIENCSARLKKEFDQSQDHRAPISRSMGFATALAAVVRIARDHPLYGSVDTFSNVLSLSIDLLKASGSSELRLSAAQIQVAWTIIGGLMSLGPSFVKVHLNQLLLLWRNALPIPLTAENAAKRSHLELSFLSHVRECALGALLVFLEFNTTLLTHDATKRISNLLHNSVLFLESLPRNRLSEEISNRLVPALQLHDLSIMLRRRLLQCFLALLGVKHVDHREALAQSDVLNLALKGFINPENPLPKSLESSVASSASTFERIWDHGDNWAFGVNGLVSEYEFAPLELKLQSATRRNTAASSSAPEIDSELIRPTGQSLEHDPVMLYGRSQSSSGDNFPAATAVVNNGILLFAITLPLQSPKVQESAFEQLVTILAQPLQREPGKKVALQINITVALLCSLIVANGETAFIPGKLATTSVEKAVLDIIRRAVADVDPILRNLGALALGRLCNITGSHFTNNEVKYLIDTIVANRDPNVRSGCALAMGCVHSLVGGMAASFHLKSIVGVLLSLCSDGHPVVHFWALKGLIEVCDSAGLTFSSYATSTLGLMAQLYCNDNHSNEAVTLATSNMEVEHSSPPLIGRCVDAVLNVLGPDLQDVTKARQLILTLVGYFRHDDITALQAEGSICLGHLSLYAPAHLPFAKYVLGLQRALRSNDEGLQHVAIQGLSTLMKRNAQEVFRVANSSLGDDLWTKLDELPGNLDLQSIFHNWLSQTFLTETAEWVQQCQTILSKTRAKKEESATKETAKPTGVPDLADEEVAGFAAAAAAAQGENPETAVQSQEFLRWQTRDFAMCLLSELISLVSKSILPEQVIPAETSLQSRIADIVRMAFSASTANVVQLRVWGLKIIDQILRLFGRTPDPDFLEASLLEQYQAQIASALTPAFAADSTPDLAAEAISVCATFVSAGIVTTVERMGRIFKVLVQGLNNIASPSSAVSLGDLKSLSGNAQAMLKVAVLSAWAELILASNEQPYLEDIVKPYIPKLAPLWLASLQEFAQLRFEPEISSSLGVENNHEKFEERYSAFVRETRLRYYQQNWLSIVDAIAILVDKDSESVFEALDRQSSAKEQQINGVKVEGRDISFREEPVAFFFILFGLAFEALVVQTREDPSQALAILQALKKILRPAVCGTAIYEDVVFTETTDTLDRLAMTSSHDTQSVLVEISRNLSLNHVSANSEGDRNENLSDDIDQLFELTRIVVLVLTGLIPTLEDPPSTAVRSLNDESINLVQRAFQALVDVAEVFPSVIKADLHACIIHCFCTVLATGSCQAEVVPRLIPLFRAFIQDITKSEPDSNLIADADAEASSRLSRGCLYRFLIILAHAQRRDNDFSLPCAKNTLLSMTILLTCTGSAIPPNEPLIPKAVAEILDCLHDVGLARVASNCIRSFLLTRPKSQCDEAVSRELWPRLLSFVASSEAEDDPETVWPSIAHSLVAGMQVLDRTSRAGAMPLLSSALLSRAQHAPEDRRKEIAQRFLEIASIDGVTFRIVLNGLEDDQRGLLQHLLRLTGNSKSARNRAAAVEEDDESTRRPAIELRMDF